MNRVDSSSDDDVEVRQEGISKDRGDKSQVQTKMLCTSADLLLIYQMLKQMYEDNKKMNEDLCDKIDKRIEESRRQREVDKKN